MIESRGRLDIPWRRRAFWKFASRPRPRNIRAAPRGGAAPSPRTIHAAHPAAAPRPAVGLSTRRPAAAPRPTCDGSTTAGRYDAITLRYNDGLDGERLRYHDDKVRFRGAVRSRNLQACGDSRAGYNIINGDDVALVTVPAAPEPAGELAEHIDRMRAVAIKAREAERAESERTARADNYA